MKPEDIKATDRELFIDETTSLYLEAFECDDFATQERILALADEDKELAEAIESLHRGLMEEARERESASIKHAVAAAMPGIRIEQPSEGPATIAEVAEELGRTAGPKLKAEGYAFVETLARIAESLPANLGLSQFAAWAEKRFPGAPAGFWPLFHKASLKVERRRESQIEYQLAARHAPMAAAPPPPPEEAP